MVYKINTTTVLLYFLLSSLVFNNGSSPRALLLVVLTWTPSDPFVSRTGSMSYVNTSITKDGHYMCHTGSVASGPEVGGAAMSWAGYLLGLVALDSDDGRLPYY